MHSYSVRRITSYPTDYLHGMYDDCLVLLEVVADERAVLGATVEHMRDRLVHDHFGDLAVPPSKTLTRTRF